MHRAHHQDSQQYEFEAATATAGASTAEPDVARRPRAEGTVVPSPSGANSPAKPVPAEIAAAAPRCAGIRPEVLQRVLEAIDRRFNETLRVEELGRLACLSPFHFARMFKLSVGKAPHAYITSKRMERARALLAEANVSIAEVARLVGFRTQAHFSGVFRKQVGVTPGQFRRQHRSTTAPAPRTSEGNDVRL